MIGATKETLSAFFKGDIQYIIPFFQRPFVWEEENWEILWENILEVYLDTKKGDNSEHFIGTVILKQRETQRIGETSFDLVDGQQRLTTIAILAA
ncbi:MAG: DUF262 domain-containing protein, partial [Proteobacteria bacterium]